MGLRIKLLLLMVALGSAPLSHAQKLYKWVDKDGRVSYQDRPPPSDARRVEEKTLGARSAADTAAPRPAVVLYSAPRCGSCDAARLYLRTRGVPFTEKNVDGDRKLQDELIKQAGGLTVPTLMIGTKVMQGYLESLLEGELTEAGYPKAPGQSPPPPPEVSDAAAPDDVPVEAPAAESSDVPS